MKILLIGASGTIGRAVRKVLSEKHEIISAGRSGADVSVDIRLPESIAALYSRRVKLTR